VGSLVGAVFLQTADQLRAAKRRDGRFAAGSCQSGELWIGGQAEIYRLRDTRVEKLFDLPEETLAIA
jgi:hypothetical protein